MELVDIKLESVFAEKKIENFWSGFKFCLAAGYSDFTSLSNAIYYFGDEDVFKNCYYAKLEPIQTDDGFYTKLKLYYAPVDSVHLGGYVKFCKKSNYICNELMEYCRIVDIRFSSNSGNVIDYLKHLYLKQTSFELTGMTGDEYRMALDRRRDYAAMMYDNFR